MSDGVLSDTVIAPMTMDQVFKEVYLWLKTIGVTVIEDTEPVYIKGFWNASVGRSTWMSLKPVHANKYESKFIQHGEYEPGYSQSVVVDLLNDPFDKNLEVRINQHDYGSSIEFIVSQVDPRNKGKGLLYWGAKLEEIYERLGVDIRKENLENLFRAQLEKEFNALVRAYLLLLVSSLVIVLSVRSSGVVMLPVYPDRPEWQWDILWWYVFLVVIPLTGFFGPRYSVYNKIRKRLR